MKKNYNKPELRVVKLRSRVSLLASSEPEGQGEQGSITDNGARRASFSVFDEED
jgi:hypothetical protein